MYSIDSKIGVLRMINTVDANSKVGEIVIGLTSSNKWNSKIVKLITSMYINVYTVLVWDGNDSVDHMMHDWIKQYV